MSVYEIFSPTQTPMVRCVHWSEVYGFIHRYDRRKFETGLNEGQAKIAVLEAWQACENCSVEDAINRPSSIGISKKARRMLIWAWIQCRLEPGTGYLPWSGEEFDLFDTEYQVNVEIDEPDGTKSTGVAHITNL
jgi:hypothetical protein